MRRLSARIFLSIWLASALIGAGIAVVELWRDASPGVSGEDRLVAQALAREAREVVSLEPSARREALSHLERETGIRLFLVRDTGESPADGALPEEVAGLAARVTARSRDTDSRSAEPVFERAYDELRWALTMPSDHVIAVALVPRRPRWARSLATDTFVVRALIVIFVSGLVAFVLAHYISRPLEQLRRATRSISDGDLSVRAAPGLTRSVFEVDALAQDFDVMAERVEALVTARDQMLSDVSHELRSPLARLRVALELTKKRAGPDAAPMLARIETEAERLGTLIDQILTLHRLESDGSRGTEEVDLEAIVREVARGAALEAEAAGAQVHLTRVDPATLPGDPELLRRAVDNVVRNAVRYSPPGGAVELELVARAEHATVIVRDAGPGVAEADQARIFEPLVRLDAARTRKGGGAGLGLAIARRAVRAHGGEIHVENRATGGLQVTLRLLLPETERS